ncbi:MAG: hypothetical protein DI549_00660 [Ancylobacter novellus]|uniref:Uncharacterized protein n=1 Tax=Ancylobacter novellus TaxID=921 RepID=A0A2W5R8N7_ANCNO|nr:MAG: hypothetical protein DI549_00660 [Ancylobacter novellus]
MRASRPKLSGNARIAIILWLIALGTAFAIMLVATAEASAAALTPLREAPEILLIPPTGYLLAALILASAAIVLSVLAVVLAAGWARAPRRGL